VGQVDLSGKQSLCEMVLAGFIALDLLLWIYCFER
jgi:hypothetical protein